MAQHAQPFANSSAAAAVYLALCLLHAGVLHVVSLHGYDIVHCTHAACCRYSAPYGQAHRMCPDDAIAKHTAGCHMSCTAARSGVVGTKFMGGWGAEYDNDVLVFDTHELKWGRAKGVSTKDPELLPEGCGDFPMNDNLPQVNVRNGKLFAVGGECDDRKIGSELYTHYPQFAVLGEITVL